MTPFFDGFDPDWLASVVATARRAGDAIMAVYATDFEVRDKADRSPVTDADEAAEALITRELAALTPDIPVVAEEAVAAGRIPDIGNRPFWLVDPLDGTKEFLSRNGEFTVCIGLVHDGRPILGALHIPARALTYAAVNPGGATVTEGDGPARPIAARIPPAAGVTVVESRSHRDESTLDAFLAGRPVADRIQAGSALKFGRVAEGAADLYPRLGRTFEWDTCAGQAVVEAAGGRVTDTDGRTLTYGKPDFVNPPFVVWGRGD